MKTTCILFAALASLAAASAHAEQETFKFGEIYYLQMDGCTSKEIADLVVSKAKAEGTGLSAYRVGRAGGICATTVGLTRYLEVYESYIEKASASHPELWYVKYEVQAPDGSWMPFYGFSMWKPKGDIPEVKFECGINCA